MTWRSYKHLHVSELLGRQKMIPMVVISVRAFEVEARTRTFLLALAMPFWHWFLFWKLVASKPARGKVLNGCKTLQCWKLSQKRSRACCLLPWQWHVLAGIDHFCLQLLSERVSLSAVVGAWNQRGFPCWKVAQIQQLRICTRCLPTGTGSCASLWSRRLWWDKVFSSPSSGADCGKWENGAGPVRRWLWNWV